MIPNSKGFVRIMEYVYASISGIGIDIVHRRSSLHLFLFPLTDSGATIFRKMHFAMTIHTVYKPFSTVHMYFQENSINSHRIKIIQTTFPPLNPDFIKHKI